MPFVLLLAPVLASAQSKGRSMPALADAFRFQENRGQIVDAARHPRPDLLYRADSRDISVYLRSAGISYVFTARDHAVPTGHDTPAEAPTMTCRMDMDLVGANPNPRVTTEWPSADLCNFYLAHCTGGITGVRSYGRIIYHDIYPKIDLVYYSHGEGMKYDFVLHRGGSTSDIRLRYTGGRAELPDTAGALAVSNPVGRIVEAAPVIYQESGTERRTVSGSYRIESGDVTFNVGSYDRRHDLIIDPSVMWSTYFGGSGFDRCETTISPIGGGTLDVAHAGPACMAGPDSLITICGYAYSTNFPVTPGVVQVVHAGAASTADCFVARLTLRGTRVWATYIGGSSSEEAGSITVDDQANTTLAAQTQSPDYPVTPGAFNATYAGPSGAAVITRLDAAGRLVWSTFFNGAALTTITHLGSGDIVVGGQGTSVVQPTAGAFQVAPPPAGMATGLLARFTNGGARVWCTFLGGTQTNANLCDGVTVVCSGPGDTLAVCGVAVSTDFPVTAGAFQSILSGADDSFIARFDSGGRRIWTTLYGGTGNDHACGMAVDARGDAVVSGYTDSPDFPTSPGAFQNSLRGSSDGYVLRLDRNGARRFATRVGGSGPDVACAVDIDRSGALWLGTWTAFGFDIMTPDAFQPVAGGSLDAGVVKLDSGGAFLFASNLGGSGLEYVGGICATSFGCVLYGWTTSADFPVTPGAFQTGIPGGASPFLTAICDVHPAIAIQGARKLCQGDSVTLSATPGFDRYTWSTGETTRSIAVKRTGTYAVTTAYAACAATSDSIHVDVFALPVRRINISGSLRLCEGDSTTLSVDGGLVRYRWSNGDTSRSTTVGRSGLYSVGFMDSNGCVNRSDTVAVTVLPRPVAAIRASGPLAFCEGGSVTLTVEPAFKRYQWNTGDTTRTIVAFKSGTYTVTVQNDSGCWSAHPAFVVVKVLAPPKPSIRNLLPTTFCEGDSTILAVTPSNYASYLWSTGAKTPVITVKSSGVYAVTVTDTNGCTGTAQVGVSVTPRPQPAIHANGPLTFCAGDSVTLSASGFLLYQWSNGSQDAQIVAKQPGKYFVMVTSDKGCVGWSDTVVVAVKPLPSPAISGPVRVCRDALANYSAQSGGS
ncbi:MAG TPA: hypothetical protein VHI13_22140, partial [Candidatus Kapabacteria bacterium]|nr:hypothetical protein [Candidatus Kapabacteria bacterium]